ncbi:1-(5-phosphoribosyl)-5-[(5-phosphoribosylamino)methylideneamino] imidazole-4-carboxamide isomerase [Ruminococcaceae bacterium FB2012]|nr:1-(5-phosphoribosyl)-5-[(5-phosphoribosylamino)methylideneamino] imidazole-4-carboxamide isomerase [Ruminococcaceae bacterium FB2012]
MRFRPCIDIHGGSVKQIVGGSLRDGGFAEENFVSKKCGAYYGELYRSCRLSGGHIILLDPSGTPEYEADCEQARSALDAFPGGFQIGGGITADNAGRFLDMGASHVIVTSYVFRNGRVMTENLKKLVQTVGRERIVLDLSCRYRQEEGGYYIVTDRWQKYTDTEFNSDTLAFFSEFCSELLVHAVDVEGRQCGIEPAVAKTLGGFVFPSTYAGGISSFDDLDRLYEYGRGRVDFTVGSALDIFGGTMPFEEVVRYAEEKNG